MADNELIMSLLGCKAVFFLFMGGILLQGGAIALGVAKYLFEEDGNINVHRIAGFTTCFLIGMFGVLTFVCSENHPQIMVPFQGRWKKLIGQGIMMGVSMYIAIALRVEKWEHYAFLGLTLLAVYVYVHLNPYMDEVNMGFCSFILGLIVGMPSAITQASIGLKVGVGLVAVVICSLMNAMSDFLMEKRKEARARRAEENSARNAV